jgi:uncharacterized membrane protein
VRRKIKNVNRVCNYREGQKPHWDQSVSKEAEMSKFIVVMFPNESGAYQGTRVLKELHAEGSVAVYGMAVVAKDASGHISVKQAVDEGPLVMATGVLVGGLVGLFGGPAGVALGAGFGGLLGGLGDIFNAGAGADFAEKVSKELASGKVAVIAEIDEAWVTPLDTGMEKIGGTVVREWRSDFEEAQLEKEISARKAELAQLKAELSQASENTKGQLKARIDEAKAKLSAAAERDRARMETFRQEVDAKVKELQDQAAKAKSDAKAKIEGRITEIRADYERRSGKMKQAWELAKEALAA